MARLGLCSAILAMLVGGCGGSARDAIAGAKPSVPLYSERAAAVVADALLAAVPLPADTQHVSGPPRAIAGELGRPINIDEPKDVGRYAYWSSTDRPEAMLSFLARKGPFPKVQYSGSGDCRQDRKLVGDAGGAVDVGARRPSATVRLGGPRRLRTLCGPSRCGGCVASEASRPVACAADGALAGGEAHHTGLSCTESGRTIASARHGA